MKGDSERRFYAQRRRLAEIEPMSELRSVSWRKVTKPAKLGRIVTARPDKVSIVKRWRRNECDAPVAAGAVCCHFAAQLKVDMMCLRERGQEGVSGRRLKLNNTAEAWTAKGWGHGDILEVIGKNRLWLGAPAPQTQQGLCRYSTHLVRGASRLSWNILSIRLNRISLHHRGLPLFPTW